MPESGGERKRGSEMKFFLDSANLGEIREAAELGLIDGVTTNPSLVSKEGGVDFKEHIAAVCALVAGDVSAEVTSLDAEGMLRDLGVAPLADRLLTAVGA